MVGKEVWQDMTVWGTEKGDGFGDGNSRPKGWNSEEGRDCYKRPKKCQWIQNKKWCNRMSWPKHGGERIKNTKKMMVEGEGQNRAERRRVKE